MATEQDLQAAVGLAVSIGCSRTHADRLAAEHRDLVPAIIAAFAEIDKGFICFKVEEGETLGAAIRRFAAADHKFVDPTGREWRGPTCTLFPTPTSPRRRPAPATAPRSGSPARSTCR